MSNDGVLDAWGNTRRRKSTTIKTSFLCLDPTAAGRLAWASGGSSWDLLRAKGIVQLSSMNPVGKDIPRHRTLHWSETRRQSPVGMGMYI